MFSLKEGRELLVEGFFKMTLKTLHYWRPLHVPHGLAKLLKGHFGKVLKFFYTAGKRWTFLSIFLKQSLRFRKIFKTKLSKAFELQVNEKLCKKMIAYAKVKIVGF